MFGAANGGTATIKQYDPKTGQVLATIPSDGVHTVIRGAVNPVTGIYYYGDATRIWAYDPTAGKLLGQVGTLTGMTTTNSTGGTGVNGDFAFSSRGLMFVVAAHKVYRVDTTELPTTAMPSGGRNLSTTEIGTLPNGTNSPESPSRPTGTSTSPRPRPRPTVSRRRRCSSSTRRRVPSSVASRSPATSARPTSPPATTPTP